MLDTLERDENFATQNLFGLCLAWNFLDAQTFICLDLSVGRSTGKARVDPRSKFWSQKSELPDSQIGKTGPGFDKGLFGNGSFLKAVCLCESVRWRMRFS